MTETPPDAAPEPDARDEPWVGVASERLGRDAASVRRITRARRGRMLSGLSGLTWRARNAELDPELVELLEMIGFETGDSATSTRELATIIDRGVAAGFDPGVLPQVVQAYVRAVSRIAAVEADIALQVLREVEPERRPEVIDNLIAEILPISLRGFDLLHRAMLEDALLEGSGAVDAEPADLEKLAIGMVDLVRSTDYLSDASVVDLERVVDAIFATGQAATVDRSAHVFKYVGDGLFLASSDVGSVADAALDIIARLEAGTSLRARGGISYGPVMQRAGDVFGLPVNLSQALTKAAKPGTVLLSASAAAEIPADRRGRMRRRKLPHPALGEQLVATLHTPTAADDET